MRQRRNRTGDRVFVSEDEVEFVVVTAFIGPKHYGIGSFVVELILENLQYMANVI